MKSTIVKVVSLINIIGLSILSVLIWVEPFPWHELIIGINTLLSLPFIISGFFILRNLRNPKKHRIQKAVSILFLTLWLPSIFLAMNFEVGGLIICSSIFLLGIWALRMTNLFNKMILINLIGMSFLLFQSIILVQFYTSNLMG